MRLDPIVFIELTKYQPEGNVMVRVDSIAAVDLHHAIEEDGSTGLVSRIMLRGGGGITVAESVDGVRRKMAEAYELANEALS
jgi:hypothetical protein